MHVIKVSTFGKMESVTIIVSTKLFTLDIPQFISLVEVSWTVYVPTSLYVYEGLVSFEVIPLPKSQM